MRRNVPHRNNHSTDNEVGKADREADVAEEVDLFNHFGRTLEQKGVKGHKKIIKKPTSSVSHSQP
jgi:hypothetical protein